jgi:serine/threonine protein kinase
LIGTTVSDYTVEERIWQGATSTVYKCTIANGKAKYGNIAALKVLHPYRREPIQIKRFVKEAQIQKKLNHKNIIQVYFYGKTGLSFFIFMEYVGGKNIRNFLQNSSVTDKQSLKMLKEVAEALEFTHNKNVIHNDIKPENILYDPTTNSFKLTDFGYARPIQRWFRKTEHSGGTAGYMAPERKQGIFNQRSDIYSFGVVMKEVLTDKIKDYKPELIFNKATQKNPDKRYASFTELITDINNYLYQ